MLVLNKTSISSFKYVQNRKINISELNDFLISMEAINGIELL